MCQVSSCELCLVDPFGELVVDVGERALERVCNGTDAGECGGCRRAQEAVISAGEEEGGAEAGFGDAITEAFGQAFDEAVEAQAAQLISDGALGDLVWGAAG